VYVDDDRTIYVADSDNHRIVEWKCGANSGQVVAGGNGKGNKKNQLNLPINVSLDTGKNNLIICDWGNSQIVRWPRQNGTNGQKIISKMGFFGLTTDNNNYLYASDQDRHEVRRWKMNDTSGTLVAGGNGEGNRLNQLAYPTFIFIDEDHSIYVSDWDNHRVMKWMKGADEGIVVAGGQGKGNGLNQLSCPQGVLVDHLGTVYVADSNNHRVMRWYKGATEGNIIVGGNGAGEKPDQLRYPFGLSFDRRGNLYVVDKDNHRLQRFNIETESI
jgi:sugar lactone lactonase YvrE